MTNDEREALVARWLEEELDEAEDARALHGHISDEYRESIYYPLSDKFDEASEALLTNNFRTVALEADELLRSAGLPTLDHGGVEFARLCRRLLVARQEYLRIEHDRWQGNYADTSTSRKPPAQSPGTPPTSATPGPLFSIIIEKYMAEVPRTGRSLKPLKAELLKFLKTIGGDKPITSITKADGRAYKEQLINIRKLSMQTTLTYLSTLATVFRWAHQQGYVPTTENPLQGLAPSKKVVRKSRLRRIPFTDPQLLLVFGSQEFLEQRDANPSRYWLCLIGLFSGCRREEAGQLALADIQRTEDGIDFLRILDDPKLGQTLKNEGSRRRVPVHGSLIALGFLDYVRGIKEAGHARLFPDLRKTGNGCSDPIGKWFSRLVTAQGLTDPRLVFHSLRHGAIYNLHAAGCPDNIVEVLMGHAGDSVHEQVYEHRDLLPLRMLQEGLERLRYDGVVARMLAQPSRKQSGEVS